MKTIATTLNDEVLIFFLKKMNVPKMPSRTPPIMKGLAVLEPKDYTFLTVNQAIEAAFLLNLAKYVSESDDIERSFDSVGAVDMFLTIILPGYFMVYINDFVYYFFHRAMHHPTLYPLVHKHHHRQALPQRGYWDAANDHPFENFGGQVLIAFGIYTTVLLYTFLGMKVHAAGVGLFMFVFALFAFLNHTEFDVQLPWFFFGYTVRAHEIHHRFGRANYCQNTMIFDKAAGSFQPYKSGQKQK